VVNPPKRRNTLIIFAQQAGRDSIIAIRHPLFPPAFVLISPSEKKEKKITLRVMFIPGSFHTAKAELCGLRPVLIPGGITGHGL
jgi:hypothetical protein